MRESRVVNVPLNRVEGDLEIRVEIAGGAVSDAWSSGTMFRGFEKILVGRGAMDGLVMTPRICGLCSLCHLTAAALALDSISGVRIPGKAVRVRNVVAMAEHIQSDVRHAFLMFAPDFTNPAYKGHSLHGEACQRYEPFKGRTALSTLKESKKVLEIVAILGGQWPHTSFMVPGGVVSLPDAGDIAECRQLLAGFRRWYESAVLGCSIERWSDVRGKGDLDSWLEQAGEHREGELGFFLRFCREAGLQEMGGGPGRFLSYGALDVPSDSRVSSGRPGGKLIPSGVARGVQVRPFDQARISEHVACSWFEDYPGGRHPFEGETRPYASGSEGAKYSWCKAPRYDGESAETGPLAEAVVAGDPLFTDLVRRDGPSVMVRQLARLTRPARLIPVMDTWLDEMRKDGDALYKAPGKIKEGQGHGLTQAARGALGHWVKLRDGKIEHYQIITPTAWNASPRDGDGRRGPWEEALVGTGVKDPENPVELGHVVRSFDACLVCTVHALNSGGSPVRMRM